MMLDYIFPRKKSAIQMDRYLAAGYFRSSTAMHLSELLCFEGEVHSIVRVRLLLKNYRFNRRHQKLLSKNNQKFTVEIRPQQIITEEQNQLFKTHNRKFSGFVYPSLQFFLSGLESSSSVVFHSFPTWEINVFDGEKLVALSYFDLGNKGMASLMGAYDPAYEKYSLGIYTMLLEIEFGSFNQVDFYYPGYVLDATPKFDYKLRLGGPYQFYNWDKKWDDWSNLKAEKFKGHMLRTHSDSIQKVLYELAIPVKKVFYTLYEIGYKNHINPVYEYVKYPLFFPLDQHMVNNVAYDTDYDTYVVFQALEYGSINLPGLKESPDSDEFMECNQLQILARIDFQTTAIEELKTYLSQNRITI